jgi:hypothetical protein
LTRKKRKEKKKSKGQVPSSPVDTWEVDVVIVGSHVDGVPERSIPLIRLDIINANLAALNRVKPVLN